VAGGQTGGEQVAARGGFPVQHFPGAEQAGLAAHHEVLIQFRQGDTPGGADGFFHGGGGRDQQG